MKKFLRENATFIALIAMVIILSILSPDFFTPRNLTNLCRQVTVVGILAIGMTMVIIINGIDLAVGSVVGLSAISVTMMMQAGLGIVPSILCTLVLTGGIIGIWNGLLIAKYKIPPFIITLGMMTIARGIALTLSGGGSIPVTNTSFAFLGGESIPFQASIVIFILAILYIVFTHIKDIKKRREYKMPINPWEFIYKIALQFLMIAFFMWIFLGYEGIPVPVALFCVMAAAGVLTLNHTKFGRRIYAIGGNEEASRLSGINVLVTKLWVYVIMATLASLSGILLASRLNGASPNLGNMFELDAIASAVIGGTSLSGGTGTIVGSIIGTFIIGILNNGMSLLNIDIFYQFIVKGLIIIVAVWFDVVNKKNK